MGVEDEVRWREQATERVCWKWKGRVNRGQPSCAGSDHQHPPIQSALGTLSSCSTFGQWILLIYPQPYSRRLDPGLFIGKSQWAIRRIAQDAVVGPGIVSVRGISAPQPWSGDSLSRDSGVGVGVRVSPSVKANNHALCLVFPPFGVEGDKDRWWRRIYRGLWHERPSWPSTQRCECFSLLTIDPPNSFPLGTPAGWESMFVKIARLNSLSSYSSQYSVANPSLAFLWLFESLMRRDSPCTQHLGTENSIHWTFFELSFWFRSLRTNLPFRIRSGHEASRRVLAAPTLVAKLTMSPKGSVLLTISWAATYRAEGRCPSAVEGGRST